VAPFILIYLFLAVFPANAQMMRGFNTQQKVTDIQKLQKEEEAGKILVEKLSNKKISCNNLKDEDFELIGDYYMFKMAGSTESHLLMDQMMDQRMGKENNEQMHIVMGKRLSGCDPDAKFPSSMPFMMRQIINQTGKGGGWSMMGWGYPNMMNWGGGFGVFSIFGLIYPILITIILVLLIVWLWKQIGKK